MTRQAASPLAPPVFFAISLKQFCSDAVMRFHTAVLPAMLPSCCVLNSSGCCDGSGLNAAHAQVVVVSLCCGPGVVSCDGGLNIVHVAAALLPWPAALRFCPTEGWLLRSDII